MRDVVQDTQAGFRGGLNLVADESQLGNDELRVAANVRLTDDGGATRRRGSRRLLETALPAAVLGGFAWSNASEAQEILAVADGKFYTGAYGTPTTLINPAGAFSITVPPSFAAFRNPTKTAVCYIADGGLLNKYDGTTLTVNIASTPACSVLAVYNSRLYGITGLDEMLYASALDDGDTLGIVASGGIQAAIRTFGRQRLCGLLALGNSLLLFHERGISRFTGISIDDIAILAGTRGVSQDVGSIAPFSILSVENVGFFVSDRGFYKITEDGVESISRKIDPVVAALASVDLAAIRAVHSRATREVLFFLPGIGVYVYNYRTQAWAGPWDGVYTAPTPHCLFEAVDDDGKSIVLMGSVDGHLRHCNFPGLFLDDALSDGAGGNSYTMNLQCHRMFFESTSLEKALRWAYVVADLQGSPSASLQWKSATESGTVTLVAPASPKWGKLVWGAFVWGGAGATTHRVPVSGRGYWVELSIVDDGGTESKFSRVEVDAFNMGRR